MIDWTKSMKQSFEYFYVNESTWMDESRLQYVNTSDFQRDITSETLESANFTSEEFNGERYIRTYLNVEQDGKRERLCLNTALVQTPSFSFDGKVFSKSLTAYSPLYELKDGKPNVGYFVKKGENVFETATTLIREHCRAPVIQKTNSKTLLTDFVADSDDSWLTFVSDLLSQADYRLNLTPNGFIFFEKNVKFKEQVPVWEFNDDNSSIILPSISMEYDLCDIPNVVEVIYSDDKQYLFSRVINDNPDSPTSTISRGREIVYRTNKPTIVGNPTQSEIDAYAENLLDSVSTVTYKLSYTHGYCPVNVNDAIRLNYRKAGLFNIKAKVLTQTYTCNKIIQVSETAGFPVNLWKGDLTNVQITNRISQ